MREGISGDFSSQWENPEPVVVSDTRKRLLNVFESTAKWNISIDDVCTSMMKNWVIPKNINGLDLEEKLADYIKTNHLERNEDVEEVILEEDSVVIIINRTLGWMNERRELRITYDNDEEEYVFLLDNLPVDTIPL